MLTDWAVGKRHLRSMGYYEEGPPRHSHRSPSELAEEERWAALRGLICVPARAQTGPPGVECLRHEHLALIAWGDAHPLESKLSAALTDQKVSSATETRVPPDSRNQRSGKP